MLFESYALKLKGTVMPESQAPIPLDGDWISFDTGSVVGTVFEAMAEGVVVQSQAGTILACNSSAERILGLTADQLRGRTSMDPRWRAVHHDGSPFPGEDHPAMVTLRTGQPCSGVIMGVHRPDGALTWILINSRPLSDPNETTPKAAVTTFADITQLRELQDEKERLATELHRALTTALSGFLPICANCKSIRDSDNVWLGLEDFISAQTGTQFTHTVCPTCAAELYPGLDLGEG